MHEWLSDEVIIEELVEYIQLLDQELVECVDDSAHHTDTVSFDRVVHLIYSDGFDLFCLQGCLYENLRVEVVVVL